MTTYDRHQAQTLVTYEIVFTMRGLEVAFPERDVLLTEYMSPLNFQTWMVAEFIQRLPDTPVPPLWIARNYPPAASGGTINALPLGDEKYLLVHSRVQRRYPREALKFPERQLEELAEIRDALKVVPAVVVPDPKPPKVSLPQSMRLAGALNPRDSEFGDEFSNFPPYFGDPPAPGTTELVGWVEVEFEPPEDNIAEFRLRFLSVGSFDHIAFSGGQEYDLRRNRAFPSRLPDGAPPDCGGRLNLMTCQVEGISINATFQNSVIAQVDRLNRIPFAFPFIYPPPPISPQDLGLPPSPPPVFPPGFISADIQFSLDDQGRIDGFELHSKTIAPVALFPYVPNLFPPFSFGPDKAFFFANPTRCRKGTPPQDCPSEMTHPDGVQLPLDVLFHPHLDLVVERMGEIPQESPQPPECLPKGIAEAALASAGGRLYLLGGLDDQGERGSVFIYDPATGKWREGPPMPVPVAGAQGASIGSRIYLLGGLKKRRKTPVRAVQVLDTDSLEWSLAEKLPSAVADAAAVAAGGKVILIGGWKRHRRKGLEIADDVQIFDPSTGKWQVGQPAPLPVAGAAAVEAGGRVLLINGQTVGGKLTRQTAFYRTELDQWEAGPETEAAVWQAAAGRSGDIVCLAGGRESVEGPTVARTQILDLSWPEAAWQPGLKPPIPTASSGGSVLEGAFHLAGGRIMTGADASPGAPTDIVQVYDPASGWAVPDSKPLFTSSGVMNGAGATAGPQELSSGSRAILSGLNLAPSPTVAKEPTFELNGVSITVEGQPSPILSISPNRIDFLIPPIDLEDGCRKAQLELRRGDTPKQAPPVPIDLLPAAPGLYIYNYWELFEPDFLDSCAALACNQDGSFNFASQPACPGDEITLYATGVGNPPYGAAKLRRYMKVLVGVYGKWAEILSVAPLPGQPGVHRIRARLPDELKSPFSSNVPVMLVVGKSRSNPAVISVREEATRLDPPFSCEQGLAFFFPEAAPGAGSEAKPAED